jgi:hypothetical protein
MRKINKIINIALIFMIMGVFLSPGEGYSISDTTLRAPSIFQSPDLKRESASAVEISASAYGPDCFNLAAEKYILLKLMNSSEDESIAIVKMYSNILKRIARRIKSRTEDGMPYFIKKITGKRKLKSYIVILRVELNKDAVAGISNSRLYGYDKIKIKDVENMDYAEFITEFIFAIDKEAQKRGRDKIGEKGMFASLAGTSRSTIAARILPMSNKQKAVGEIVDIFPEESEISDFASTLFSLFQRKFDADNPRKRDKCYEVLKKAALSNLKFCKEILTAYQNYKERDGDTMFTIDIEKFIEFIQEMSGHQDKQTDEVLVTEKPDMSSAATEGIAKHADKLSLEQIEESTIKSAFSRLEEWMVLKDLKGVSLAIWVIEQIDPENKRLLEIKTAIQTAISEKMHKKMPSFSQNEKILDERERQGLILKSLQGLNPDEKIISPKPLLKDLFYFRRHINIGKAQENSARYKIAYFNTSSEYDDKVQWLSSVVLSFILKENRIIPILNRKNVEVESTAGNARVQRRKLSVNI